MSKGHAPFGDVEMMLLEYLDDLGYICTSTPPDLKDRLVDGPVHRMSRVGGGESQNGTTDNPRIAVMTFRLRDSADPRNAHTDAEAVRTRLINLSGAVTAAGRLDSGETESGPTTVPWADSEGPALVVVQCIYRLSTRR